MAVRGALSYNSPGAAGYCPHFQLIRRNLQPEIHSATARRWQNYPTQTRLRIHQTSPHAKYTKNGVSQRSKKLYADFYDHTGTRRMLPLFADQKNSNEAGRCVERLVSVRASGDVMPLELVRFVENTRPHIRDKLAE